MTRKLIKQIDFARLAGVTPGAITALKPKLGDALVGRKIDVNHPNAQAYLEEQEAKREASRTKNADMRISPREKNEGLREEDSFNIDDSRIRDDLMDLTLSQIVDLYGSLPGYVVYVKAQAQVEDYQAKKEKRAKARGDLIDKHHEARVAFEALEQLAIRLLTEIPQTLSQKIITIARQDEVDSSYRVKEEIKSANGKALKICQNALIRRLEIEENAVLSSAYKKDVTNKIENTPKDVTNKIENTPIEILY